PTLDIPIDECPGEIGIICFQITVLPNKNDKEANESKDKKEAQQEVSKAQQEVAATKQEEKQEPVAKEAKTVQPEVKETPVQEKKAAPPKKQPIQPKGTKDVVSFEDIIVPEAFLKTRPNPVKTEEVIEFV
ncbi:plasmid stabilization protein, partial [Priestia aryabhattai]